MGLGWPLAIDRSGASLILTWSGIPGLRYWVQAKNHLSEPDWNDLAGEVLALSPTATKTDTVGSEQRFYRIRVGD